MGTPMGNDVLPLFVVERRPEGLWPTAFLGTGFVAVDRVLVTAWHVVRGAVDAGHRIVALTEAPEEGDRYLSHDLDDISPDPAGLDMATARIALDGPSTGRWRSPTPPAESTCSPTAIR